MKWPIKILGGSRGTGVSIGMRLIALIFFTLSVVQAQGEIEPFYLAADSGPFGTPGIYRATLDSETGRMTPPILAVKAKGAGFLALRADGKVLLATFVATIGSYEVEPGGKLSALSEQPSGGDGPCHISFDHSGRAAFVANYGSGNVTAFDVAENGVIGNRFMLLPFTGSGPNAERQSKSFAHSVYADPQDKFIYACDLGSDSVWIFKFNPFLSKLTPAVPPAAKVPPGSGPRHLAFSTDNKFVYVVNEMGVSVTTFARDPATGSLTPRETVSALMPAKSTPHDTGAEIFVHPNGHFLYATVRGCDVVAVFSIAADGVLTLIQNVPSVAKFPRSFALDPSGKWLIVGGQNDGCLARFTIDSTTGMLTASGAPIKASGSLMCVLFAK